jgi:hypothetical protein
MGFVRQCRGRGANAVNRLESMTLLQRNLYYNANLAREHADLPLSKSSA